MGFDYSLDKADMKGILEDFHKQIGVSRKLTEKIDIGNDFDKIFILGMGGSALPGDLLECYLKEENIPITTSKDYTPPSFVDERSIVFVISFSGNTEESIDAYKKVMDSGAKIVVISSGGKLEKIAKENDHIHIKVPGGLQPRQAIGYQFFPVLFILQNSGMISDRKSEIEETEKILKDSSYQKDAQDLASKLERKIPLIYSSTRMKITAEKWKIGFNENTKTPAFYNVFPELNHNEMNGFINVFGEFKIIIIRDDQDHARIRKRMDVFCDMMRERGIEVINVPVKGKSQLSKIFSSVYLSDWVSYYLALRYGIDPSPVDMVEKFKRKLDE